MRKIYTSADQLIGKTPLLELVHIEKSEGLEARVLGKLEYFNPAGSVKDRIAKAMIDDAVFMQNGVVALAGSAARIREQYGVGIVEMYRRIYGEGGVEGHA